MGSFQPNGMSRTLCGEKLNQFALVTYIPDPLGGFLDNLRRHLLPSCNPHAHVSILPPRPLAVSVAQAQQQARAKAMECAPFEIEAAANVEVFSATNVIYVGIAKGRAELDAIYEKMNAGAFWCEESLPYHPHITLAQEFDSAQLRSLYEEAARCWAEYKGSHVFRVESVSFVQNTAQNCWIDLAELSLGGVPSLH